MKKILVLTGSPRKDGNTDKLAAAFETGAKEAGHEVVRFDAGKKVIGGCHGCNNCWSSGHACCRKDDFRELEPLLESCDAVAFITPLYWLGFPAQLKAPIDKLYAYGGAGGTRPLTIKESCLIVCGELEPENREYEPLKDAYRQIAEFEGWKDHGVVAAGGFGQAGIESTDALIQAGEMGRNF
ncbi:MAG: flavodoxin family protein [Oscillibacter sp.]|nr:flavodoxin family protein [Oscillibacter sp.]